MTQSERYTARQLKELTVAARENQIAQKLLDAAKDGDYETRVKNLFPEQKKWLTDNGYEFREIIQKGDSEYDINWEK